jgi:hypothetical protein
MLTLNPTGSIKRRFPIHSKGQKHTASLVKLIFGNARRQASFWDKMGSLVLSGKLEVLWR